LTVEDEQLLDEQVELVTCRWCGASGAQIEELGDLDDVPVPGPSDA
jgi:hypothetical protein